MNHPDFNAVQCFVREKLEAASGCHDFDHTMRVLRNAEKLARLSPEANLEIVRMAALLHDVARPEEMASAGKVCHAKLGAKLVFEILSGWPASFVQSVSDAVRTHRYRNADAPTTCEAKIVYDADKLDSLGAVGIGRAFLFAGRVHARLHNTTQEALNAPEYSREDTAWREYLVKLRHLPEALLTSEGRRIADERAAFMREFFDRLNQESDTNLE